MSENVFEKAGTFASDAAIDTGADSAINKVIDAVAEHLPGGGAIDAMAKTGVDLAANNAINSELSKISGGMFGKQAEAAPAEPAATAAPEAADDSQT